MIQIHGSWWYLLLGALQAFLPATARSDAGSASAADDVETPGSAEMEDNSVAMQEEISIPPADLAEIVAAQDQRIKTGWVEIITGTARRLQRHMLGAISAVKVHICGVCWIYELSMEQSDEHAKKHLKRLYEYTKKSMGFDGALIIALFNQQNLMSNSSNIAFKVSLVMLLVTFLINLIMAILLMVGSFNLAFKYPIYISSVIGMFMPFALLVSYGQLHPYMILISLLPFFSITLFHGTVTDEASELLDHIFDMSAGVYALFSAGCVRNPYFISKESVAASLLACSLFLTIFVARYLMLISTLRPPVIVEHAETLMFILKRLLVLTAIFVTVEFIGWELALVALSLDAVDAVLFSMSLLAHIPGTTTSGDKLSYDDQRKEQQLLSAVFVVTLFTIIVTTKAFPEYAAAQEGSMGSAAKLGMFLCICAFLCSLNRMLITRADVVVAAPPEGGHGAVKVFSTLELARASVLAVAALYIIYKIGSSAFSMGSN